MDFMQLCTVPEKKLGKYWCLNVTRSRFPEPPILTRQGSIWGIIIRVPCLQLRNLRIILNGFQRNMNFVFMEILNRFMRDAGQFEKVCRNAGIPCEKLDQKNYFNAGCVEEAYKTQEYTYDAVLLRDYFLTCLAAYPSVQILCRTKIDSIWKEQEKFCISCQNGKTFVTAFLLNAAYAAANMISDMARMDLFKLKYELCEIILCKADEKLRDKGITVMDGPFFSIMPFGKTGYHSLTSVTFTPHETSFSKMPEFSCQKSGRRDLECGDRHRLGNCNLCDQKPESAWDYMAGLAEKYLRPEFGFAYEKSLFSVKPVLASAEIDDSRPTVIRVLSKNPVYIAVLSGKINTVYDLDEVLDQEI